MSVWMRMRMLKWKVNKDEYEERMWMRMKMKIKL